MPWIQTYQGGCFEPFNPQASQIKIRDIAHALALTCRFTGHCTEFYSVAQHSVMVSQIVSRKHALAGLLHDASEAYLTDVASPIKRELPDYRELENTLMLAISNRYHLDYDYRDVKHADLIMLATERRDLMNPCPVDWFPLPPPLEEKLIPWPWDVAEFYFLRRFYELV